MARPHETQMIEVHQSDLSEAEFLQQVNIEAAKLHSEYDLMSLFIETNHFLQALANCPAAQSIGKVALDITTDSSITPDLLARFPQLIGLNL